MADDSYPVIGASFGAFEMDGEPYGDGDHTYLIVQCPLSMEVHGGMKVQVVRGESHCLDDIKQQQLEAKAKRLDAVIKECELIIAEADGEKEIGCFAKGTMVKRLLLIAKGGPA